MTFEIRLTQLPQGRAVLDQAVQEHISKMEAFNKTVGKPRPVTNPIVEACVRRVQEAGKPDSYVPDYVVIDDTPPPPPALNLDDRKAVLLAKVVQAEFAAKGKVLPSGKVRLTTLKMHAAQSTPEEARTAEQVEDIAFYTRAFSAFQQIEMAAAQAQSDIEDLTEETIESWVVPQLGAA